MFNVIIAIFFFMEHYGNSFFQMFIASKLFRNKEVEDYSFFSYIKQNIYNILLALKF